MGTMDIDVDTKRIDAFLDTAPRETGIALLRALKRGTQAARTHAARVVAKDMGLKVGEARNAIRIVEPTGQTLTGELRASLRRVPLIKFGAKGNEPSRGRGRGVSYRGKGGRKRVPHGFIATMPSGHRGVFERKTSRRLPIRQLYGPSVGRVLDEHRGEVLARGEERFEAELNRQLDRFFGGGRA